MQVGNGLKMVAVAEEKQINGVSERVNDNNGLGREGAQLLLTVALWAAGVPSYRLVDSRLQDSDVVGAERNADTPNC